jgi:hypothetical protein
MAEPAAATTSDEPGGTPSTLPETTVRAVAERVYELMRDDLVVQRERRGLSGARWR